MKVLHFSKYYPPTYGGIERVVYDISTGLSEKDIATDILCTNSKGSTITEQMGRSTVYRGREFAVFASTSVSPATIGLFRKVSADYDVIHVHLPNPLANIALMMQPRLGKVVLHWHSDIIKQKTLLRLYSGVQKWMLKRADAIIATSKKYAEGSHWLTPYPEKTHIVPIGINTNHLTVGISAADNIRRRFSGRPIIFSLGRLTYYKGFEFLIRAARDLDNAWILIGGDGEERENLEALIREYGVADRVILLGGISPADIGAYYSACDIFCLPSHIKSEAFGIVQLEAMASAKPVVSCDIPGSGVGWVNEDGTSGLIVPPGDEGAITKTLNQLLRDQPLRARLARGARQRYEALFTKERMVHGVLDVYRSLQPV